MEKMTTPNIVESVWAAHLTNICRCFNLYQLHILERTCKALARLHDKIVGNVSSELLSVDRVDHDWCSLEVHIATEDPLSWLPLPKSVRQQIRETYESFPACGSASQPSIETRIEDQGLSCGIANCPKIPHRIAAQERLRKVPNFARKGELPDEVM
jgi:hypothetical protein